MTKQELQIMQAWSLETKVLHSIQVIETFLARLKLQPAECYVSFSGGADSLVMLDIARRFIAADFPAVFCQTGQEWPEVVKFVRTFENVEIIRPKYTVKQIYEKYGFPLISKEQSGYIYEARTSHSEKLRAQRLGAAGRSFAITGRWRWLVDAEFQCANKCCTFLKKAPFHAYERATGRKPLIGTTAEESNLRLIAYVKRGGCNSFTGRLASYPMSIWTRRDVWQYIEHNKLAYCEIYDQLEHKQTGCVSCGYGAHTNSDRLQTLYRLHPKLYAHMLSLTNSNVPYREALRAVGVKLPDE